MSRDKAQSTLGMMDRKWDCWKGARGGGGRQRERPGGRNWGRGLYEVDVDELEPLAEEGQRVAAVEELDVDDLKEDESSRASY